MEKKPCAGLDPALGTISQIVAESPMSMKRTYDRSGERSRRAPDALGEAEAFLSFQEQLSAVAKVNRPVLIVGERGTGKELAVSRIHYLSHRWQGPFVALNSAALSPSVVESELFGHESGAFTGATRRREGRFEAADGGTLFLDEIGLIPVEVQEKILRVVEYREFERVGGSEPVQVDVRLVGATNANLPVLAREGRFKRDLLDRLSFEVLFLPPLRERREDILLLARHFGTRMMMELGRPGVPEFAEDAVDKLEAYRWPGNIRELKNVIERAVYKSPDHLIEAPEIVFDPFISPFRENGPEDLAITGEGTEAVMTRPAFQTGASGDRSLAEACEGVAVATPAVTGMPFDLNAAVRELELAALCQALEEAKYHQGEAAKLLKLTYHQFRGLYRKYQDVVKGA
jgi:psp operon transcriptional activator